MDNNTTQVSTTEARDDRSVHGPDGLIDAFPPEDDTFKEDRGTLRLSAEYAIKSRQESGHRLLLKTLAQECHFVKVSELLDDPCLDTDDPRQAKNILDIMMVRKDAIDPLMRVSPEWDRHAGKKVQKDHAGNKSGRVKDGKWLGNVLEMISVCCGSYRVAWLKAHEKKAKLSTRNFSKLLDAGIVVRKFPRWEPKRGTDPVYVMMFPERHLKTVEALIKTTYKIDESRDMKKDHTV
jgi:hypothetical protein